jgi:hypothetical protein
MIMKTMSIILIIIQVHKEIVVTEDLLAKEIKGVMDRRVTRVALVSPE